MEEKIEKNSAAELQEPVTDNSAEAENRAVEEKPADAPAAENSAEQKNSADAPADKKAAKKRYWWKTLLKVLAVFLLLIIILLGILIWKIDDIAASGIKSFGSKLMGSQVDVESVDVTLTRGAVQIKNFTVANPRGFQQEKAISVNNFMVDVDLWSLPSDEIVVEYLEISGMTIDVEYKIGDDLNLNILINNLKKKPAQANAAEQSAAPAQTPAAEQAAPAKAAEQPAQAQAQTAPAPAAEQAAPAQAAQVAAQPAAPAPAQAQAAGKKVTIRKMVLKDIKFTFSSKLLNISVPMELPDLTLENIDSKQTPEEITAMVLEKLLGNIWVVLAENKYTQQLKALGEDIANQAAEALKESGKALQKEIDSLLSETKQNVQNALDEGKKELQNVVDENKKELQNAIDEGKKELRNSLKELLPTPKRKNSKDKK